MSFDRVLLGDVCEITMGQAPSGDTYNTEGEGLPLIAGAGDFGALTPEATKFTTAPTKVSRHGDIILCIRATIGDRNWSDTEYCLGRGVAGLAGRAKRLDQTYLWHWLGHAAHELKSKGRGATFLQVNKADIATLEIPLPTLIEQRRIAAILDKADALRAKRREAIAKLDQLLESVFFEMFGDPVTNPKRWPFEPLGNLLQRKTSSGAYYPSGRYVEVGGVAMVHMSDAFYGVIRRGTLKRVAVEQSDIEKYGLSSNDILVSRRSLNYEGSAKPCLIQDLGEPLIFESSLIRVSPDRSRLSPLYLFHYLSNSRARSEYIFKHVTRSTISGISQAGLNLVEVMVPDVLIQESFAAVCGHISRTRASFLHQGDDFENLFSSIQQKAFSGIL